LCGDAVAHKRFRRELLGIVRCDQLIQHALRDVARFRPVGEALVTQEQAQGASLDELRARPGIRRRVVSGAQRFDVPLRAIGRERAPGLLLSVGGFRERAIGGNDVAIHRRKNGSCRLGSLGIGCSFRVGTSLRSRLRRPHLGGELQ
jgi:hypothetical protein